MTLRTITNDELTKILKDHKVWAESDGKAGTQADLSGACLSYADLRGADLSGANLEGADLSCADLSGANLEGANLRGADLEGAYLYGANLRGVCLEGANLRGADLEGAYLYGANLYGADLRGAYLYGANLEGTLNIPDFQRCPKIGTEFHAFKKVKCSNKTSSRYAVLELLIPSDAKRVSSTGTKCRADRAVVLKALDLDGAELNGHDSVFNSLWNSKFTYEVGKEVQPSKPFNDDIRVECASGIHFFLTFDEAKDYWM